ncbi:TPA: DUF4868 domain-containing protein [Yersinia enterocolitica]|jgi:hypothetical protein|nr:DUF4868 domain-containing protein [Salmonella enterica subsp. enterica]HDU2632710.1 DUF4868 domain-containing protein [Yersinia enterocolitica]HEN3412094.1 DUF4868 domain-containing protein [Yersinia enterocolitica]
MTEELLDLSELHHDAQKASELSSYYAHFDVDVSDFDLHVYFNFRHKVKKADGNYRYEYKLAKINETKEIKESLKENVISKTVLDIKDGKVAISNIKDLSDRANTISFLEDAESYKDEQMAFLTGIIFDKGFGGDGDVPVVNFDKVDKISKVDSIIFVLRKGDKCITIYKKQYPIQNLSRQKNHYFAYSKDTLSKIDTDMISIDGRASVVFVNGTVYIYDQDVFERFFGYKKWIKKIANDFVSEMEGKFSSIVSFGKFFDRLKKEDADADAFSRKLARIYNHKDLKVSFSMVTTEKITDFLDENEYFAKLLKYDSEGGGLEISTHDQQEAFILIVSEGVLRSLITGFDYLSPASKRKITTGNKAQKSPAVVTSIASNAA